MIAPFTDIVGVIDAYTKAERRFVYGTVHVDSTAVMSLWNPIVYLMEVILLCSPVAPFAVELPALVCANLRVWPIFLEPKGAAVGWLRNPIVP